MPSYHFAPNLRKRITARFITRVRRELQKAFLEEKEARGITQAELARVLGVDRAVVNRQLAGTSNLTLRTLADYAWALQRDIAFAMPKYDLPAGANLAPPALPGTSPFDMPAVGAPSRATADSFKGAMEATATA